MRTLKLTIAYDGTRYAGWQTQRTRSSPPTIQQTLERILQRILQEPVRVVGSGRTDAGAHALAQVAHVKTRSQVPVSRLLRSLNQLLPPEISVLHIHEAPQTFHARFGARRKRYAYRVFTGPVVPPFIRPYVHHVTARLNTAVIRREATVLAGRHDFKAFARAGQRRGTIRTIHHAAVHRRGAELQFEFEGNGFLHTMVRSMVGTLIDVGRGRLPPGTVRRMLTTGQRGLAGTTAPACGLTLLCVRYGREDG